MIYLYHKDKNISHIRKVFTMQVRRYLYGMIGFLSLLGFIGVFSEERNFPGILCVCGSFYVFLCEIG